MSSFFTYIGAIGVDNFSQITTGIIRILLAAFCGALIGIERGKKHRPAGLRTHMLVCIAAALVMITNELLLQSYGAGGDPTRMGAQVISGIGFLGAGTIMTDRQNRVRGLTTAAGLWSSACIGLAIGGGYYLGGLLTCFLMLTIFDKLVSVEQHIINHSQIMGLQVTFDSPARLTDFISEVTEHGCNIMSFTLQNKPGGNQEKENTAELLLYLPGKADHESLFQLLKNSDGLLAIEYI